MLFQIKFLNLQRQTIKSGNNTINNATKKMVKSISIFQLQSDKESRSFLFMPLEFVENNANFGLARYNEIYQSEFVSAHTDTEDILDDIYFKFNMCRPKDFKGHSLSTSDIVKMDNKYYYCDEYGWSRVRF